MYWVKHWIDLSSVQGLSFVVFLDLEIWVDFCIWLWVTGKLGCRSQTQLAGTLLGVDPVVLTPPAESRPPLLGGSQRPKCRTESVVVWLQVVKPLISSVGPCKAVTNCGVWLCLAYTFPVLIPGKCCFYLTLIWWQCLLSWALAFFCLCLLPRPCPQLCVWHG